MVICRRNYEDTCTCRACRAHAAIMAGEEPEVDDDER